MKLRFHRSIAVLATLSLLRGWSSAVIMAFLPLYGIEIGMDFACIGLAVTIANIVTVFSLPLMGWFVDVGGRRPTLFTSTICMALSLLLPAVIQSHIAVMIAYSLFYLSFFSWQIVRGAMVIQMASPTSAATVFATLATLFQLARTVAPSIVGIVISMYGYRVTFLAISMFMFLGSLLITIIPSEKIKTKNKEGFKAILSSIKPKRNEIPLLSVLSIDRFGWMLWFPLLNPYLKVYLELDTEVIGLIASLINGTTIATLIIAGRLADRIGWLTSMLLSEIFAAIGTALLIYAKGIELVMLATIFLGLSIALWIPSFDIAISSVAETPNAIGCAYSRANMVRTLASVPAPMIGGELYTAYPRLPLMIGTALMVLNAVILTITKRREKLSKRSLRT